MKPIIGIVTKPHSEYEQLSDIWLEDYIRDGFREAVFNGGCLAAGILPPFEKDRYNRDNSKNVMQNNLTDSEKSDLEEILEKYDGFILQGGSSGDYYEFYIAEYAIKNNIPIIGICAGFNMLARAAGGEITYGLDIGIVDEQHSVYNKDYRHKIHIVKKSMLWDVFKSDNLYVNSRHIYFLEKDFVDSHNTAIEINAISEDITQNGSECTTVEAFMVRETRFAMGIKWHPEDMDEEHRSTLFGRFLDECRSFACSGKLCKGGNI